MWTSRGDDVQVLVIDVKESKGKAKKWAKKMKFTFPVLHDAEGKVAASYAPKGVLPEIPRHEVAIASNLIIDKDGKIQFFELLDSRRFDSKLVRLTARKVTPTGSRSTRIPRYFSGGPVRCARTTSPGSSRCPSGATVSRLPIVGRLRELQQHTAGRARMHELHPAATGAAGRLEA